jgi:hypothetical protein
LGTPTKFGQVREAHKLLNAWRSVALIVVPEMPKSRQFRWQILMAVPKLLLKLLKFRRNRGSKLMGVPKLVGILNWPAWLKIAEIVLK